MLNHCVSCQHSQHGDLPPGQHCYMFAVEPDGCRQHTGRAIAPLVDRTDLINRIMPLLMEADMLGELEAVLERLQLKREGRDFQTITLSQAAEAIFDRLCAKTGVK